jgi:predicted transcriptional regulator
MATQDLRKVLRKPTNWTQSAMDRALSLVRDEKMSLDKASMETGVPKTTIRKYLMSNTNEKIKKGAPTILSANEETDLVNWIIDSSKKGYCPRYDFL